MSATNFKKEIDNTNDNLKLTIEEIRTVKHFEHADNQELEKIRDLIHQFAIILYKTNSNE